MNALMTKLAWGGKTRSKIKSFLGTAAQKVRDKIPQPSSNFGRTSAGTPAERAKAPFIQKVEQVNNHVETARSHLNQAQQVYNQVKDTIPDIKDATHAFHSAGKKIEDVQQTVKKVQRGFGAAKKVLVGGVITTGIVGAGLTARSLYKRHQRKKDERINGQVP